MHLMTLFLVSLGLLLLPTVAHAQPAYTVAEIGGLAGFAEVYPAAVNSTGHVVGTARDPETGLEQAVRMAERNAARSRHPGWPAEPRFRHQRRGPGRG
jgi:hypothetical protein